MYMYLSCIILHVLLHVFLLLGGIIPSDTSHEQCLSLSLQLCFWDRGLLPVLSLSKTPDIYTEPVIVIGQRNNH